MAKILGLKHKYSDMYESIYYYNDALLSDGIVFKEENTDYEDRNGNLQIRAELNIKVIDENDAQHLGIYCGDILDKIQTHLMLKEILGWYESYSREEFVKLLQEFSSTSMTSKSQSTKAHQDNIRQWVEEEFEFVENDDLGHTD
ncbi:hypothetical protein CIL05_07460 [Virgibacillus profundi]|uniref:Uncharacterized protein n=1 Tax=Virgibacillus profundi TaxID=2024555 RepID=A0A2A2IG08_9BACI|nr:hypothetical protein [Virgibacillus profundi]PAV30298.1 hypothetical protein CIL05_07460 [Virgibacillus profundi]PXY54470.1 hypothetical protein CIT14_07545 [Virgibacillus profundi]